MSYVFEIAPNVFALGRHGLVADAVIKRILSSPDGRGRPRYMPRRGRRPQIPVYAKRIKVAPSLRAALVAQVA